MNKPTIYVDISHIMIKETKTGVHRVVKNILFELKKQEDKYNIKFVYGTYKFDYAYANVLIYNLTQQHMTSDLLDIRSSRIRIEPKEGDIFFGLDMWTTVQHNFTDTLLKFKEQGVKIYYLIHDLLPYYHPAYFSDESTKDFVSWMNAILQCSTGFICVSKCTQSIVNKWLKEINREDINTYAIRLGSDHKIIRKSSHLQQLELLTILRNTISFITVGTIEPRKGHTQLLEAFNLLWKNNYEVTLLIVGKEGWLMHDFTEIIKNHKEYNKRLFWLSEVDDSLLESIYNDSKILIFPSEEEGFGLPIIEASKYNKHLVLRDIPVFKEIAENNACYFENTRNAYDLYASLVHYLKLYNNNEVVDSSKIKKVKWIDTTQSILDIFTKGELNEKSNS